MPGIDESPASEEAKRVADDIDRIRSDWAWMRDYRGPILLILSAVWVGLFFGPLWSAASDSDYSNFAWNAREELLVVAIFYTLGAFFLIKDSPLPRQKFIVLCAVALGLISVCIMVAAIQAGVFYQPSGGAIGATIGAIIAGLISLSTNIKAIVELFRKDNA
jgi:peptidoglycan/LPS O-acetylase OafA/YrhL